MEHAPIDFGDLEVMAMAVREPATPLARVPGNDPVYVKRALDTGVLGIMVPHVDSREEAKLAAASVRYPPKGVRGVGPRRAARFGLARKEYLERANGEVMLIVQIESRESVENMEEIITVEGVDAYFIGPSDLSASMGYLGNWRAPEVVKAIEKVAEAGRAHGVPGGIYCPDAQAVKWALDLGLTLLAIGSDYRFLVAGAQARLEDAGKIVG